jgi:hypothetical protein
MVYVVSYEILLNSGRDNRLIGVASTLELARNMAAEWLLQRHGYTIDRWPDHDNTEYGNRFWYTDVHGHIMQVNEFAIDAPVLVEPAEDE